MKNLMKTLMYNDDCSYLYDRESKLLYVSLSFENLNDLDNCDDYFVVDVFNYDGDSDAIAELVEFCKGLDELESRFDTIRDMYGSEVDESTGQEIVGGNICIEDVDFI